MAFVPISYWEKEVGKKVANTKRRYIWTFQVDGELYELILICSFISGKRMVLLNSTVLGQSRNYKMDFQFKYTLKDRRLLISQEFSVFRLTVDSQDYITLLQDAYQMDFGNLQSDFNARVPAGFQLPQFEEFQGEHYNERSISRIKESDFDNFQLHNNNTKVTQHNVAITQQVGRKPQSPVFGQNSVQIPITKSEQNEDLLDLQDSDPDPYGWLKFHERSQVVSVHPESGIHITNL